MKKLLLLAMTVVFVFGGVSYEKADKQQRMWILECQDAVKDRLKDANSAKFKNVFYSKSGGVHMTCGEVNSKNSFGGYSGNVRFISAGKPEMTFFENEVSDFQNLWDKFCK